jgi:hypothetical protein
MKQLLKESDIRKMMKYADIGALSDTFVSRLQEQADMTGDEDDEMGAALPDEGPEGEFADVEAPEGEEPLEDPEAEGGDDAAADALQAHVDSLTDLLSAAGPEGEKMASMLSVEREGEEGPDAEMDMEMDMELPPEGDEEAGMPPEGEFPEEEDEEGPTAMAEAIVRRLMKESVSLELEEDLDEDLDEALEEVEMIDEEDLVNEVAQRVARRLRAPKRRRR